MSDLERNIPRKSHCPVSQQNMCATVQSVTKRTRNPEMKKLLLLLLIAQILLLLLLLLLLLPVLPLLASQTIVSPSSLISLATEASQCD